MPERSEGCFGGQPGGGQAARQRRGPTAQCTLAMKQPRFLACSYLTRGSRPQLDPPGTARLLSGEEPRNPAAPDSLGVTQRETVRLEPQMGQPATLHPASPPRSWSCTGTAARTGCCSRALRRLEVPGAWCSAAQPRRHAPSSPSTSHIKRRGPRHFPLWNWLPAQLPLHLKFSSIHVKTSTTKKASAHTCWPAPSRRGGACL
ncbi:hypothetical protein T484DRAFT_1943752 [Baffinella frigidus]|nr:hypothetical protein T484DRAFT_1943752 [Cryptophyta sp. CCMP2293]